jgi:small-conductance mechanosensitive channel
MSNPFDHTILMTAPRHTLVAIGAVLGAIVVALVVHRLLVVLVARAAQRSKHKAIWAIFLRRCQRPAAFVLPLLGILMVLPSSAIPDDIERGLERLVSILTIAAVTWGAIVVLGIWADISNVRRHVDLADNLRARQIETRVAILHRTLVTIAVIVGVGTILMTFPNVRAVGTTLLASAGIAGLAAGFAARPIFENLVAGVQIAFTQPIRIDDVVIVEKEWGRIEQITATYVIVKTWDLRRLVVPLTYFINTPFQNWTRQTAELIGTVMLYTDYTVPVDALRAELETVVASSPLWDGKVWNLQVSDALHEVIELRMLVSAANASDVWDLRCYVREKMIAFVQERYPEALPRTRIETRRDTALRHENGYPVAPRSEAAAGGQGGSTSATDAIRQTSETP